MVSIVGIVLVIACVLAGFLMDKGKIGVLVQPAEVLIIVGAAIGTIVAANPIHTLKQTVVRLINVVKGAEFPKSCYVDTLKMLFDLLARSRKEGSIAIESDIETPEKSPIFSRYPDFLKNHHALNFVCDTLRMAISGDISAHDIDQMMELDIEVHGKSAHEPIQALTAVADALPGLGIVAAVLGVVVTMGSLGGPPEEIGRKVAAALVGTFLGILLCYGVVGPLAAKMAKAVDEEHAYYHVLRVVLLSFVKGTSPIMSVEVGRRAIPEHCRPTFVEVEKACRQKAAQKMPGNAAA